MDMTQLATFLGWCTVLNFGFLLFATVALMALRGPVLRIHGALFDMTPEQLNPMYVTYLANFKIFAIVFNLVPWIALKIM